MDSALKVTYPYILKFLALPKKIYEVKFLLTVKRKQPCFDEPPTVHQTAGQSTIRRKID